MGKYPIHEDFRAYAGVALPLYRPLLPPINALLRYSFMSAPPLSGVRERRVWIPGEGNARIGLTIFEPEGLPPAAPCLVYFHGGAFVLRAAPVHKKLACAYALHTPCRVVFAHYRLAPRHPFPAGLQDCYVAYDWARHNAAALDIDPRRIAVGGDSAGGALAAGVCLLARDNGVPLPCFQMLVYPVADERQQTPSMRQYTDTPLWDARRNKRMWALYLRAGSRGAYASPLEAPSLAGLPAAYVEVAEFDCLRDEGVLYAEALARAGADVVLNRTRGTVHGFEIAWGSALVRQCVQSRVRALQGAFGPGEAGAAEPEHSAPGRQPYSA